MNSSSGSPHHPASKPHHSAWEGVEIAWLPPFVHPRKEVLVALLSDRRADRPRRQDQTEYQRRFDKLNTEHARLLADYDKLLTQISDLENRQATYRYYKEQIATLDPASIEFTPYLWHTFVDHADIATDGTISFTFWDGAKQTQPIGK